MRFFCLSIFIAVTLLSSVEVEAVPFAMINGGSNGATEKSSIGIEAGGTQVIMNKIPLSAEISVSFTGDSIPSDTNFNTSRDEPFTSRKLNNGPEVGFLFKSGVNLDDIVPNLTLQVGAGYALQSVQNVATGTVSGAHWQLGDDDEVDVRAVGYGGLLYRVKNFCISAGYNNRRGIVAGIGSSW